MNKVVWCVRLKTRLKPRLRRNVRKNVTALDIAYLIETLVHVDRRNFAFNCSDGRHNTLTSLHRLMTLLISVPFHLESNPEFVPKQWIQIQNKPKGKKLPYRSVAGPLPEHTQQQRSNDLYIVSTVPSFSGSLFCETLFLQFYSFHIRHQSRWVLGAVQFHF